MSAPDAVFLPAAPKPWFVRWFTRYSMRKLERSFFAVRAAPGFEAELDRCREHDGPLIVAANHCSWWDPLVGLALLGRCLAGRTVRAPMDLAQLRRFGFFRGVGLFGVDPDNPASLEAMREYVLGYFAAEARPTLWITPQGRFEDVRQRVRLRPGAAALAAGAGPRVRVVAIAMEYAFWSDQKPELFLRAEPVVAERASTSAWHRALSEGMQANADALAALVMARDPGAFVHLSRGSAAKTNPMWDVILRLRGQSGSIDPTRAGGAPTASPTPAPDAEAAEHART